MSVIEIHEMAIVNGWIYGINYKYSALCKIDSSTNEVIECCSIIDSAKLQYDSSTEFYRHIYATETMIFIINTSANYLLIFNQELQLIKKIYMFKNAERMNIVGGRDDKVFIYAVDLGKILEVNIKTQRVKEYVMPKKYIGKINSMAIKVFDNSLWFTGYLRNRLLELNVENGNVYEHIIDGLEGDVCLCEKVGSNIWICTQNEVFQWDKERKTILHKIDLPIEKTCDVEMPFYYGCVVADYLFLFPFIEKMILKIDNDMNVTEIEVLQQKSDKSSRKKTFGFMDKCDGKNVIFGLDCEANNVLLRTDGTSSCSKIDFVIAESLFDKIKKDFYIHNEIIAEGMIDISEWLKDISRNVIG